MFRAESPVFARKWYWNVSRAVFPCHILDSVVRVKQSTIQQLPRTVSDAGFHVMPFHAPDSSCCQDGQRLAAESVHLLSAARPLDRYLNRSMLASTRVCGTTLCIRAAGTTIAAIAELETSGMRGAFIRAVKIAAERSEELSRST